MTDIEQTLALAPRCLLAAAGPHGPVVGAAPFWWDGAGLWILGTAVTDVVTELGTDAPAAAHVASQDADAAAVLVRGPARVYGAGDPIGVALRAPAVMAAASALALKLGPELAGYARDLPRVPTRRWPAGLALVRVLAEEVAVAPAPPPPAGISPALPSVVPPAVRRILSGHRQIVLATADGKPRLAPASWSADLRLHTAEPLADGVLAAGVVADGRVGLALEGRVAAERLRPERARWWQGLVTGGARVPAGLELPD